MCTLQIKTYKSLPKPTSLPSCLDSNSAYPNDHSLNTGSESGQTHLKAQVTKYRTGCHAHNDSKAPTNLIHQLHINIEDQRCHNGDSGYPTRWVPAPDFAPTGLVIQKKGYCSNINPVFPANT